MFVIGSQRYDFVSEDHKFKRNSRFYYTSIITAFSNINE